MTDGKRGDLLRLSGGDDIIEIAHDLFSAPVAAGNLRAKRRRLRFQFAEQPLGLRRDLSKLKRTGLFSPLLNRLTNLRLGGLAESGELRDPSGFTCTQQIVD